MTATQRPEDTRVSQVIQYCQTHTDQAEHIFNLLSNREAKEVNLGGEKVNLSEDQVSDFLERYSTEVESILWESKRRKN